MSAAATADSGAALPSEDELATFQWLVGEAPMALAIVDAQLRYLRVNAAMAELHGLTPEAHIGRRVEEVVPGSWELTAPFYRRALAGEPLVNEEFQAMALDGQRRDRIVSYYPIRAGGRAGGRADGEIRAIGVMVNDVTARRAAERALETRNGLYAMLSRTGALAARAKSHRELYAGLCTIAVETGRFRLAWVGEPRDGRVAQVAAAGEDHGYLEKLEVPLDEGDPRSHGPVGEVFRNGRTTVVNDFAASPLTVPWHGAAKRSGLAAAATFALREQGQVVASFCVYADRADFFDAPLTATLSELTPIVDSCLDRLALEAERVRDEAALRLHDRAIQAVGEAIVICDARLPNLPVTFVNPSFERMTGYRFSEILGKNLRLLQGPDTDGEAVAELRAAIAAGRGTAVELLNHRRGGEPFWSRVAISPVVDAQGALSHYVGVQTDVTAQRKLQAQLRQAQKMEAIGQLAGGVAHDFNNLLSVMLSYTDLLGEELDPDHPGRASLQEVVRAGSRAAELTRQLLAFSRQQVLKPQQIDLGQVVGGMEPMLGRIVGEDIRLTIQRPPQLGLVRADPGQIEQVVMNLVVNARDAMPQGGKLAIELADLELDAAQVVHLPGLSPGPHVRLAISDSGEGMAPEVRDRIFEPFFTTKQQGKGTGLGLSTVFGIVKQSQGHIAVISAPQRGTSFAVYLPRTAAAAEAAVSPPPEPPAAAERSRPTPGGDETLLLVEDEEQVRVLARALLRRQGYTVLEAANGGEALLICETHPGPIHLLLSDVVLPHLSGVRLAERLLGLRPTLRVLLTSGYGDEVIAKHGGLPAGVDFVPKPLTPDLLLRTVRALLDRPPTSRPC